jgi:hypothetical protein
MVAAIPALGARTAAKTTNPDVLVIVNVTLTDKGITLDKKSAGGYGQAAAEDVDYAVAFAVTNKGKKTHNFTWAGIGTTNMAPGTTQHIAGDIADDGPYPWSCNLHCTGKLAKGMTWKGIFTIVDGGPIPTPPPDYTGGGLGN